MNCVYMLECADGSFYIGWTNSLKRRIAAHSAGRGAKYTRSRLPVRLVYFETHEDEKTAKSREFQLKRLNHRERAALVRSPGNECGRAGDFL